MGGHNAEYHGHTQSLSLATTRWSVHAAMPVPRGHNAGDTLPTNPHTVLLCGGFYHPRKGPSSDTFLFSLGGAGEDEDGKEQKTSPDGSPTGTWTAGPAMRAPRSAAAACSYAGEVVAMGGADVNLVPQDRVEALDVARGVWREWPRMLHPRAYFRAVVWPPCSLQQAGAGRRSCVIDSTAATARVAGRIYVKVASTVRVMNVVYACMQ